jgi:hypothetical protein
MFGNQAGEGCYDELKYQRYVSLPSGRAHRAKLLVFIRFTADEKPTDRRLCLQELAETATGNDVFPV